MWDRIKEYLTSWKTENFGNGTGAYENKGLLSIDSVSGITIGPPDGEITTWGIVQTRVDLKSKHGIRLVTTDSPAEKGKDIALSNKTDESIGRILIYYWDETAGFK